MTVLGERDMHVEANIPAEFKPREYGRKSIEELRLGQLIMFDQVRSKTNPKVPALRESFRTQDLINQIDVARLERESLEAYINFVNRVWRAEHDIEAFSPDENGFYYVVIAGHSRTAAMILEEKDRAEKAAQAGFITDPHKSTVWCKIHDAPTPQEILSLQLNENLYEAPSEERRAMAMVEAFEYGYEMGLWKSRAEFVKANPNFSPTDIRRALVFLEFDPVHRAFVLDGVIKYGPAVELGKVLGNYRKYVLSRYFNAESVYELADEDAVTYEKYISEWVAVEFSEMSRAKINITAARARYKSLVDSWAKEIGEATPEQDALFDLGKLAVASQRAAWQNERRSLERRHAAVLDWLLGLPLHQAEQAVSLNLALFPDGEEAQKMQTKAAEKIKNFVTAAGSQALREVALF